MGQSASDLKEPVSIIERGEKQVTINVICENITDGGITFICNHQFAKRIDRGSELDVSGRKFYVHGLFGSPNERRVTSRIVLAMPITWTHPSLR